MKLGDVRLDDTCEALYLLVGPGKDRGPAVTSGFRALVVASWGAMPFRPGDVHDFSLEWLDCFTAPWEGT